MKVVAFRVRTRPHVALAIHCSQGRHDEVPLAARDVICCPSTHQLDLILIAFTEKFPDLERRLASSASLSPAAHLCP